MLTSSYRVFNLHLYEGTLGKNHYFCEHFKKRKVFIHLNETTQNYTVHYQS